jgi:hypothetical protein
MLDDAPDVDARTGRPLDFIAAPIEKRQALWPRAVASIAAESPYAAALVAQHALTAYDHYAAAPEWQAFFATLRQARDTWLARSGHSGAELDRDYILLRIADLISLGFCNGWTETVEVGGRRLILAGDAVEVSPDPFDGREITLTVAMRAIPNRPYVSGDDLKAALDAAPSSLLIGRAHGAA